VCGLGFRQNYFDWLPNLQTCRDYNSTNAIVISLSNTKYSSYRVFNTSRNGKNLGINLIATEETLSVFAARKALRHFSACSEVMVFRFRKSVMGSTFFSYNLLDH
jgi:hypothetical protein